MSDEPQAEATPPQRAPEPPPNASLLRAAPGLARIATSAWWNTAQWAVGTWTRASARVMRAAVTGQAPAELFRTTGAEIREQARRVLGLTEGPEGAGEDSAQSTTLQDSDANATSLRERGAELLRRSADVALEEDAHPAYTRILADLTPDEGRILRLLALEGAQPSVDVRAGFLPFNVGSELVAPGLTMIGSEAGCRHLDDVPAYLSNLFRLGLVWLSREPLSDPLRYQVLEAQPEVLEALREAGRARTVRRSILLTPFGDDFCRLCLPLETAELEALPATGGPLANGERQPGPSELAVDEGDD